LKCVGEGVNVVYFMHDSWLPFFLD